MCRTPRCRSARTANAPYHFEKGLLRQVLRERTVRRAFKEKAVNVVVIQAYQLVERLSVAALTFFYQGFFVHRFFPLFVFICLHAGAEKGWCVFCAFGKIVR